MGVRDTSSRSFENILCIFSVELQCGIHEFPRHENRPEIA